MMSIGFLFWLLVILWAVFGVVLNWGRGGAPFGYRPFLGHVLLPFILFCILGYHAFGWPIHG